MPKRKRNKKPNPIVPPSKATIVKKEKKAKVNVAKKNEQFSSTAESLEVIKSYHTLNKRLEQNARDDTIEEDERRRNAEKIRKEQEALGGIEKYQLASMYGAKSSKFVCAHWVEPLLREHIRASSSTKDSMKAEIKRKRPLILDVGAIDNQYLKYDWFDAVPIDLNAQHESVVQADFFDYAIDHIESNHGCKGEEQKNTLFDAIVLSLVLNFQGDPRKRGDMLSLAADARLLGAGGLVFVALPSASLDNSRYCDEDYLIQICEALDLKVVQRKRSAKLALLTFQRVGESDFRAYDVKSKCFQYQKEFSRAPAKKGEGRNNFAIMLKNSISRI